jgi:hypothetical protein
MSNIYPPAVQRAALLKLLPALGCRDAALRRDECGDWRINGKCGHVYAAPGSLERPKRPGFRFFIGCEAARGWTYAKKALSFAKLTNDGDDEGSFFLDRRPVKRPERVSQPAILRR